MMSMVYNVFRLQYTKILTRLFYTREKKTTRWYNIIMIAVERLKSNF